MQRVIDRINPQYLADLEAEIARSNKPGELLYVDVRKELGDFQYYVAAHNAFQLGTGLDTAASDLVERARDSKNLRGPEGDA